MTEYDKKFMDEVQQYYGIGIPYSDGWDMDRVKFVTKLRTTYWVDNVYDYESIKYETRGRVVAQTYMQNAAAQPQDLPELDDFLWQDVTGKLESSRQLVAASLVEFGLSEPEAHFLSIRFVRSTISKFRMQMFIQFGGENTRRDFNRTPLRNALNVLDRRLEAMDVYEEYLFSKKATEPKIQEFKIKAARETARILVDECGAIMYAKLTL